MQIKGKPIKEKLDYDKAMWFWNKQWVVANTKNAMIISRAEKFLIKLMLNEMYTEYAKVGNNPTKLYGKHGIPKNVLQKAVADRFNNRCNNMIKSGIPIIEVLKKIPESYRNYAKYNTKRANFNNKIYFITCRRIKTAIELSRMVFINIHSRKISKAFIKANGRKGFASVKFITFTDNGLKYAQQLNLESSKEVRDGVAVAPPYNKANAIME